MTAAANMQERKLGKEKWYKNGSIDLSMFGRSAQAMKRRIDILFQHE